MCEYYDVTMDTCRKGWWTCDLPVMDCPVKKYLSIDKLNELEKNWEKSWLCLNLLMKKDERF